MKGGSLQTPAAAVAVALGAKLEPARARDDGKSSLGPPKGVPISLSLSLLLSTIRFQWIRPSVEKERGIKSQEAGWSHSLLLTPSLSLSLLSSTNKSRFESRRRDLFLSHPPLCKHSSRLKEEGTVKGTKRKGRGDTQREKRDPQMALGLLHSVPSTPSSG